MNREGVMSCTSRKIGIGARVDEGPHCFSMAREGCPAQGSIANLISQVRISPCVD